MNSLLVTLILLFRVDSFIQSPRYYNSLTILPRNNEQKLYKSQYLKLPKLSAVTPENESNNSTLKSSDFNLLKNLSFPNILAGVFTGITLTLIGLFTPFFISYENHSTKITDSSNIEKSITLFEDILVDLKNGYVDDINPDKLFETAISAMLKSLDPYTEYENLVDAKAVAETVSGKYGGVGMVISGLKDSNPLNSVILKSSGDTNNDIKGNGKSLKLKSLEGQGVVVVDAFEGYAYDHDIRVGDKIISIDGKDTTHMNVDEVRDLLRGEPGTEITIQYERDQTSLPPNQLNKITKTVSINREQVRISDVRLATYLGSPQNGIGYISLSGFNADAAKDFASALLMLRYSAPFGLQGLVLDLRGNPGGLLDAAIDVASYLVPSNSPIVSAKAKNEPEVIFKSSTEPIRSVGMKLAVLVNGGSASASEIVSGAVQDLDAGVIIGPERTYGKGLVQKIVPLPYDAALKYTVAKYYTPSGRCIQSVKYLGGRDSETSKTISKDVSKDVSKDISKEFPDIQMNKKPQSDNELDKKRMIENENERTGDGATLVGENDRRVFYTKGGRVVKDGGGIEPDIVVDPFRLSATESTLLTQNLYSDFVTETLHKIDVRSPLRDIAQNEKISRTSDPRFDDRVAKSPISKFFVLPTQYMYDKLAAYHAHDTKTFENTVVAKPSESQLNRWYSDSESTAYNSVLNRGESSRKNKQLISNQVVSSSSAGWEKELFTLENTKRKQKLNDDKLFREFKKFVERLYLADQIELGDAATSKLQSLEMELRQEGYEQLASELSNLRPKISRIVLDDIDKHRSFIYDSIELTLLSRELPDRLLLYRSVVNDPQVEVARKVLVGATPSIIPGMNTKTTQSGTEQDSIDEKDNESDTVVSFRQDSSSSELIDGSKVKNFAGLYETILKKRSIIESDLKKSLNVESSISGVSNIE